MDLDVLEDAVVYPWADGTAGTTLVFGGIVTLLSPLLLPGLLVLGFGVEVVAAALQEESELPAFGSLTGLLLTGCKAAVTLLVYVLLPMLAGFGLLAVSLGAAGFRFRRGFEAAAPVFGNPGAVGGLLLLFGVILTGLLVALLYVAPAAIVQLARTRRLRGAFAVGTVREIANSDTYASAWLLGLVIIAATGLLLTLLELTGFGLLLGGFVGFYALVVLASLYGQGGRLAIEEQGRTADSAIDEQTETVPDDQDPEPEAGDQE
jgi:hypothetical protein